MNREYKTDEFGDEEDGADEEHVEGHENQYEYELESFKAVRPGASITSRFWIAIILDGCGGIVLTLRDGYPYCFIHKSKEEVTISVPATYRRKCMILLVEDTSCTRIK